MVPTRLTKLVGRGLDGVGRRGGLTLVTGWNGCGKSWAVQMAADENRRLRVLTCPPAEAVGTPRAFYRMLAMSLGLETANSASAMELAWAVIGELKVKSLSIVLDNAEELRACQLRSLRYLIDLLPNFALVGAPALRDRLNADPAMLTRTRLHVDLAAAAFVTRDEWLAGEGADFSQSWVDTVLANVAPLWANLAKVSDLQRSFAQNTGKSLREAGAAEARLVLERAPLVSVELPAEKAARRAA